MATTKKVARGGSLKKKAVLKKSASYASAKTPAKKKSPLKKELKTPAKKKSIQKQKKVALPVKKVQRPRTSKSKVVTIQDKTTSTPKVPKGTKKPKATKEKKGSKKRAILPTSTTLPTGLGRLYVTGFPINLDTFTTQTARVGGLILVMLGAFFTLLYSQYVWNTPIVASDMSGVHMVGAVSSCTSSSTSSGSTECDPSSPDYIAEHEPPVTISIESQEPVSGTVPIRIQVENAQTVNVLVFKESYATPINLGPAKLVSQGVWVYQWDTTLDEDDFYKVAVDVTNVYTTDSPYRDSDSKYLEVVNNPVIEEEVLVDTVVDEVVDLTPKVSVRLRSDAPVVGTAHFEVRVDSATRVTLVAHHIESGSNNVLGTASEVSENEWKYSWDTTTFTDGEYKVSARVRNAHGSYTGGTALFAVKNKVPSVAVEDEVPEDVEEDLLEPAKQEVKVPTVALQVMDSGTLSDIVDIRVDVDIAAFVELWVIPEGSQTRKIIGLAKQVQPESSRWIYELNTSRIPNAEYQLFARVKNKYGLYESNIEKISVYNQPLVLRPTGEQKKELEKIQEAIQIEQEFREVEVVPEEKLQVEDNEVQVRRTDKDAAVALVDTFTKEIEDELRRLIVAYRSGDADSINRAEARLERLKQEIISSSVRDAQSNKLTSLIEEHIAQVVVDYKVQSQRIEQLITNRVGDEVFKDSDSDGISDYDELTLYKTDPFTADSDGDGFIDGVEVSQGYDPLDSKREVAITYESPQEKGVVREDILAVNSVESVLLEDSTVDADGVDAQAVFSGKALPNSFVTLYIFSTPIVVTVKTEQDGSWKYRFDKELEDGEHNVYVGLTDNAGRIVAKSEPFTFVKEAQAFSPVNASVVGSVSNEQVDNSLLSTYMIYLILSISVVSIGLVLILLGLHLDTRQRRFKGVGNMDEDS